MREREREKLYINSILPKRPEGQAHLGRCRETIGARGSIPNYEIETN
jgi:hypothetical protein